MLKHNEKSKKPRKREKNKPTKVKECRRKEVTKIRTIIYEIEKKYKIESINLIAVFLK